MNDPITEQLNNDIAIASALRTFLTSPAIISMIQACVTEAANAEVRRLMSADLIRNAIKEELEDSPRYFTRAIQYTIEEDVTRMIDEAIDSLRIIR